MELMQFQLPMPLSCNIADAAVPSFNWCCTWLQQLAERQVSMMSELEKRMEEERTALRQEAAAMAASAAAAGEDKARAVLSARYLAPVACCSQRMPP